MNKILQQTIITTLCAFSSIYVHADVEHNLSIDLDFDGKPDKVIVSVPQNSSDDYGAERNILVSIRIDFDSRKNGFDDVLPVTSGIVYSLMPHASNKNYLGLDFTNRTSRSPVLIISQIYRWNDNASKLCLYAEVTGISRDQLNNEIHPSLKQVKVFDGCMKMADSSPSWGEDEDNDYWKKNTNIKVNIVEEKAWLYGSPDLSTKTKMYLIKNDLITIKDYIFSQKNGEDWFLIEFRNTSKNTTIIKWIKAKSIGLVLPD
jgi:hypothetical protein